MQIVPNSGAIGAQVHGLNLSCPLDLAQKKTLLEAWQAHFVLVFRDQRLDDDGLVRLAETFGELDPPGPNPYGKTPLHPTHPELNVISHIVEAGRHLGNLGDGEAVWHADLTYVDKPPKGAILHALEIPPSGGDTHFANMFAAYDALPDQLRKRMSDLRAIHDAAHNSAGMLRTGYEEVDDVRLTPGARHPLARTCARRHAKCLFLGRRPGSYVLELGVSESEALLDDLWAHATQPEFAMSHQWRQGDVLMWDNLSVLHRRDAFDPGARRRLHRAQLKGDEAIV
ncbi:MAG: taurine dioxygenase [Gammaproteobacteria bacterium]|jgi:taurine dioxygenase